MSEDSSGQYTDGNNCERCGDSGATPVTIAREKRGKPVGAYLCDSCADKADAEGYRSTDTDTE